MIAIESFPRLLFSLIKSQIAILFAPDAGQQIDFVYNDRVKIETKSEEARN